MTSQRSPFEMNILSDINNMVVCTRFTITVSIEKIDVVFKEKSKIIILNVRTIMQWYSTVILASFINDL